MSDVLALELDDLTVRVGEAELLRRINLSVSAGVIVAVIGANGAGKTTLLDVVCGLVPTVNGRAAINGVGTTYAPGRPPDARAIGRGFQGSPLPASLTVAELALAVAGDRPAAAILLQRFGLTTHASSFVGDLSTGTRRILDLAVATVHTPHLLLLDEPASGLSPSEIDRLAELIVGWRDRTGAAVLLVEHDVTLVRKIADEVIVLDQGSIVDRGCADDMLDRPPPRTRRLADAKDERFGQALARVRERAAPAMPPLRHSLSTWTLLRFGLVTFSVGLVSALVMGVLNRVLKVELGVSLALVAPILAATALAAPLALVIGHLSDRFVILGRRRTPWIVGGAVVSGLGLVAAPSVTAPLANGATSMAILAALVLFVVMGFGLYGSQTVFFALLADMVGPRERGNATSLAYTMLMTGVLGGVVLSASVLDADASGLQTLFAVGGFSVIALTLLAVWGVEGPGARLDPAQSEERSTPASFFQALKELVTDRRARIFFVFVVGTTFFLLFHRAVLEPYGGEVLGLDVRATAAFNAVYTLGFLLGTVVAGRGLADRWGHQRIAGVGLVVAVVGFATLAASAATQSGPPSWISIFLVGLATGIYNVGTLSLMLGMVKAGRVAMFMGAWSVAIALADGFGAAGGGVVFEFAESLLGSAASGYALVFVLQAVGVLACLPLLKLMDPAIFETDG